jgi:predicted DNA-binding protein (UPF0251 family)
MKPDATLHNPAPEHIRALVSSTGLSQRECARRLGISERALRYYLCEPVYTRRADVCPYAVQYALERLAAD